MMIPELSAYLHSGAEIPLSLRLQTEKLQELEVEQAELYCFLGKLRGGVR